MIQFMTACAIIIPFKASKCSVEASILDFEKYEPVVL